MFTIKDNNNDDNTWYYDISDGSLKYAYCSNSADDYVVTPAIELGTAHMIEVVFDAKAGVMGSEKLEVTYGKSDRNIKLLQLPLKLQSMAVIMSDSMQFPIQINLP